jgi:hypothetical protein
MRTTRRLAILFIFVALSLTWWAPVGAQSPSDVQYFPETGHNVRGDFLRFFKAVKHPLLVFGYPITDEFTSEDGKTVQYFQRARFELRTDLPKNQRVQLTALGQALYTPGNQKLYIDNSAACQRFSTGFRVCFAFLDFYKENGGAAQFGDPISSFEYHDNLIVQFFEKARFEWRADRPEGQRVVLADLGRLYFDQMAEDAARLKPISEINATINNILSINARAFVQKALAPANGQQTVNVVVQSQTNQAISGANGKATIHFPDGHGEEYFFTTNASGLGSITFHFANQKQGEMVTVDVLVTYEGLATTTTTSFRIWY